MSIANGLIVDNDPRMRMIKKRLCVLCVMYCRTLHLRAVHSSLKIPCVKMLGRFFADLFVAKRAELGSFHKPSACALKSD
jgi:hypothetical protein